MRKDFDHPPRHMIDPLDGRPAQETTWRLRASLVDRSRMEVQRLRADRIKSACTWRLSAIRSWATTSMPGLGSGYGSSALLLVTRRLGGSSASHRRPTHGMVIGLSVLGPLRKPFMPFLPPEVPGIGVFRPRFNTPLNTKKTEQPPRNGGDWDGEGEQMQVEFYRRVLIPSRIGHANLGGSTEKPPTRQQQQLAMNQTATSLNGQLFRSLAIENSPQVTPLVITSKRITLEWTQDGKTGHLDATSQDGIHFHARYGVASNDCDFKCELTLYQAAGRTASLRHLVGQRR